MKYFSKIKKALVHTLMAASLLLVGAGLSSCGDKEDSSQQNIPQLFGFDVGESITVDQYGLVLPKNVHVTGEDGTMYDVIVTVRDSNGNIVSTDEGNKFNAYDADGYTITYSIETWEFSTAKTVKVLVNKASDNLDFEIECDTLVSLGDTVTFDVVGSFTNPQYTVSVVNQKTGEACETDGSSFQPTAVGKHTLQVAVKSDEGNATQSKQVYVRKPLQEGEVEVFEEDWLTVREFSPKSVAMEGTWSAATTAETGIKDAEGNDGTYAVLETNAEYTHIYFNIRENRAYYRNLAMQGYTHVRFRIYVDSPAGLGKLFAWEHNSSNSWRTSLNSAPAGKWKEFYIPLAAGVAGDSDKTPGFIESYEYYQSTWILLLDNSTGPWNPNGRDTSSFKIYFDDVFAVRRTHETTISTSFNNDVYDFSSMLNRAWGTKTEDYTYSITKHTNYGTEQNQLVNNQVLTSNDVDLSALSGNNTAYGSYEIVYNVKNGDPTIPYQRVWINVLDPSFDVYGNSARGMLWKYQDPTAKVRANEDGTMVYTAAGSWSAGLQIAPAYELEYYKALQQEGYTALTFDLKLDVKFRDNVSDDVKATTFQILSFGYADSTVNYQSGETHTVRVSLARIITFYNELQNVSLDNSKETYPRYTLFDFRFDDKTYSPNNHEQVTFTISDFKMVKA